MTFPTKTRVVYIVASLLAAIPLFVMSCGGGGNTNVTPPSVTDVNNREMAPGDITARSANTLQGDVDGDSAIDGFDAVLVLRHDVGLSILTGSGLANADTDNSGDVDGYDAVLILRCDVGLIDCTFEAATTPETHDITYTANGFSPDTLSISDGDSVRWTNNSGSLLRIAEGTHPVHTDCIFCPQGSGAGDTIPISNGADYTFLFTGTGTANMHNHLNPEHTLVITVQ